jgi:TolB-like protein/Flp pilus assembly protein TadD
MAEEDRGPQSTDAARLQGEVGPHAHHPRAHFRLFEKLKQRNVFRVGALYLVVSWLILDPVHVVFHMLDVPVWADRLVVVLIAVGFPAALVFAWVYEVTPEGLKPTVEVPHGQSIRKLTGRRLDRAIIAVLAVALAYFLVDKFWLSKRVVSPEPGTSATENTASRTDSLPVTRTAPATPTTFAPPPHSIAVLPFVNMSGDKEQEYFSDGLSEELLNSLSRINELQVAARTSSFYFKGEHADLATIAHKLNVAAVLEGSVRRSAHTVRITAQLINTDTGFHLWSQTYDRNLGDVLALQSEIANTVASALKVTLLGDATAKIELGGTRNPAAFDAYLRGWRAYYVARTAGDFQVAIAAHTEAIRLDPNYALAFAARSNARVLYTIFSTDSTGPAVRDGLDRALADAHKAIALAPELGEAHSALGFALEVGSLDFARASEEYERSLTLSPGSALVLRRYAEFAAFMGRADAGVAAARHAVALDPLNFSAHAQLGGTLRYARRYDEAIAAYQEALVLNPGHALTSAHVGLSYYALGNFQNAGSSCEIASYAQAGGGDGLVCLALTYDKLGRHADAEGVVAKMRASAGDAAAYQYAEIYAQWGNTANALDWLETAMRLHDSGLGTLKVDPLLDPLRREPRFRAIEGALKFPP